MRTKILRICCLVFMFILIGTIMSCDGDDDDSPVTPQSATVRWWFEGDYSAPIYVQIYSQDRNWVWPSSNEVFVFPNDDQSHYFDTECNPGERLCFGAWPSDGAALYWGVGPDNTYSCTNCCTTCEDKTVGPLLLYTN